MLEEPHKKKKGALKLVSRKSTKKMLGIGKWKKLDSIDKPDSEKKEPVAPKSVIGLPLTRAVEWNPSFDGIPLPAFFRQAIDFVEAEGLGLEGIYRISSPKTRLDELETNAGKEGVELKFFDAHEAAGLIKRFLRQLPHSLIEQEMEIIVSQCGCTLAEPCSCLILNLMREEVKKMPKEYFYLLAYIFLHSRKVIDKEADNKMSLQALGLLLQAVLDFSQKMICYLLNNPILFTGVNIEPYTPPRSCTAIEQWRCEDKPLIEQELLKQRNLLDHLHHKISTAGHDQDISSTEERLWQVQTAITALKRRLKAVAEPTAAANSQKMEEKPCAEMYEEKQLMAVQTYLREDILEERRQIALLLYQLHLFETEHGVYLPPSDETEEIGEEVAEEEEKQSTLVAEIDKLRTDCAILRANIEISTQAVMTSTRF